MTGPKVAIFSLMRDREHRVEEYKNRIYAMQYTNWTCNICEGDSKDNTYELLKKWESEEPRVKIFKLDLGKPFYGSVVCPERFFILATCNNFMLDDLATDNSIDYFMYYQMDLNPHNRATLIQDLMVDDKDVVGPMIWGNNIFYDLWAHEFIDGKGFPPQTPAWYKNNCPDLFEVKNLGSMFLAKSEVLQSGVRFSHELDVKGFCNQARDLGFSIWIDQRVFVDHT